MRFRKAFFSILSTILLLAIAWLILLFNQSILEENNNNNLNYIPKNSTFAMRLDAKELAEKTLFSIFLESKDEEIMTLFDESIQKSIKKEGQFKNYGIDFLSDIILFEIPYKKTVIPGVLVNVSNHRRFIQDMKTSPSIYAYNDNVGVILMNPNLNYKKAKDELKALAQKIVMTKESNLFTKLDETNTSGKFVESYAKGSFFGKSSYFGNSNMLFELQNNSLLLSGNFSISTAGKLSLKPIEEIIKPKDLHFSSSIIPSSLNDTLKNWLDKISIKAPIIDKISLNFSGIKVINHSTGFLIIPQIELFIECETNFSIQQMLSTEQLVTYFDYDLQKGSINFQEERLFFKQLTPKSFYVGITENPSFIRNNSNSYLRLEGSLEPITKIQGGGLMTAFLEMMPIFRASKKLCSRTEKLSIQLIKQNTNNAELKGELKFSKGYYPMNEIVKFLMIGQMIK